MDTFLFAQLSPFTVYGAGASMGYATLTLSSMKSIDGVNLAMTDFGTIGFGTIEPGNSAQEEQISFTGITQNANGTATLTGVKTVMFLAPYTQTANLAKSHIGGSQFIISNTSGFYDRLTGKANDETISGKWTFPGGGNVNAPVSGTVYAAPTDSLEYASKGYVDGVAIAGAPKATEAVYGITKLSVAAASATAPIAVGDNDARVPSQGENDALVGTSGTPSSTNKYVTNDDTSATAAASKLVRTSAGSKIVEGFLQTTDANVALLVGGAETTLHSHAGLGASSRNVGVGTSTSAYWNYQIPMMTTTSNSPTYTALWTQTNLANPKLEYQYAYNWSATSSSTSMGLIAYVLGLGATTIATAAFGTKNVIVEFSLAVNSVGTDDMQWGLGVGMGGLAYNDATTDMASFSVNKTDSKLYAHSSAGGGTTDHLETEITGITLTNINTYRIEYIVGTSVKFYVNGVLKATNITNLPNSGNIAIGWGNLYHGSGSVTNFPTYMSLPSISIQR